MTRLFWLQILLTPLVILSYVISLWGDWRAMGGFVFLTFRFLFCGNIMYWILERRTAPKLRASSAGSYKRAFQKIYVVFGKLMIYFIIAVSLLGLPTLIFFFVYVWTD